MADEPAAPTGRAQMIGAQALMASLVGAGVDVCFMNPGTSEMHFVHSLDTVPGMRGVLGLFEGVATGAADGYARICGRPAAVLLHLGPGLGNGLANLHNARRARSPVVCIVGAHATGHVRYDAPLQSDIEAVARTVSGWVHTCGTTRDVAADAMRAVQASGRDGGQVATLVLPADVSWGPGGVIAGPRAAQPPDPVTEYAVGAVADIVLGASRSMLLLGGRALTERGLRAASRVAVATGAQLLAETFPARMECGAGLPTVGRLAYMAEQADVQLAGLDHMILVGARAPVSFFAYPGRGSDLVPDGCSVTRLADWAQDVEDSLEQLAARVAPQTEPLLAPAAVESATADAPAALASAALASAALASAALAPAAPAPPAPASAALASAAPASAAPASAAPASAGAAPAGAAPAGALPLTVSSLARAIAATLPERAIVVDEANTSGLALPAALAGAARHSLLTLTGGAIGQGLPVATGAAIAAPDRRVVCLEADGSALYTIQALWTHAREQLDITTVVLNNSSYAVLRIELARVGASPAGDRAARMLSLASPTPDFAGISRGLGVPATRVTTAGELQDALRRAHAAPGPHLIEAIVPAIA